MSGSGDSSQVKSNNKAKTTTEEKSKPLNYRELLLRSCYQRIPATKTAESLSFFVEQLSSENYQAPDTESEVTEDMFVQRLCPILQRLNVYNIHRKLAVTTYRFLSSSPNKSSLILGCNEESLATSLRFDLTVDGIASLTDEIIAEISSVYDKIANLSSEELSINSVLLSMIRLDQEMSGVENTVDFLQNVHPCKDIRGASNDAEIKLRKFNVDLSMRRDVYKKFAEFVENVDCSSLNAEWKRFLDFTLRDFKRAGLALPDEKYDEIKAIKKRMSELSAKFSKNLNEENTKFVFEESDLDGMPEDWKNARKIKPENCDEQKSENIGKYAVNIKYPDLFPILRKCRNASTREKMLRAHNTRCIVENTPIMEELVELRHKHALLLGKKNHAQHVLEIRMAKDPDIVWKFINDLNAKMEPLAKSDMDALLALKKEECKENNFAYENVIKEYDFRYYAHMRETKQYSVDHELLKDYFPIQIVIKGALDIYQQLLSLKFIQVPENECQYKFWHPEVELYQVMDCNSNQLMGYFFLDLHPREGKYGHACMVSLQSGCVIYDENGNAVGKQLPASAMLCNFPKPTESKPSLLSHDDVVTFFHEFGHVMHGICGQPQLSRFSGTRVERDFVEAPSQMLENWCWKSESLNRMSGHYKNASEKIPKELLENLVASKNANCGLLIKRQLYFSILDQSMHTCAKCNTAQLCAELQPKIWGIEVLPETNFVSSFGHLAGGYDAQYYGYMWSEVYSADMFYSMFGDKHLLDAEAGMRYRTKVLSYGGSRDAMESLTDFLGRVPNNDAFLVDKGLKPQGDEETANDNSNN